jgi:hypothetical protein
MEQRWVNGQEQVTLENTKDIVFIAFLKFLYSGNAFLLLKIHIPVKQQ